MKHRVHTHTHLLTLAVICCCDSHNIRRRQFDVTQRPSRPPTAPVTSPVTSQWCHRRRRWIVGRQVAARWLVACRAPFWLINL